MFDLFFWWFAILFSLQVQRNYWTQKDTNKITVSDEHSAILESRSSYLQETVSREILR